MTKANPPAEGPWWGTAAHRAYLVQDAARQFAFFRRSLDPAGGFHAQAYDGSPIHGAARELHATTRMVHAFALGHRLGISGADEMVDHGMKALWTLHRDNQHGGYLWSFAPGGAIADDQKLAYGHAFVLLAGASAKIAGHPDADRLIADVLGIIETQFWDHDHGRMKEEYARDWSPISTYRGMNANMHSIEALLAATEATGDHSHAMRARLILDFFVGQVAPKHDWRLPEHYTEHWQVDAGYEGNPMFRPRGATPGHSMELSRLLLQAWDLGGRRDAVLTDWSDRLYTRALADGWDHARGGLIYTVDGQGAPLRRSRYWWPVTEAIGAAAARLKHGVGGSTADEYRLFWQVADQIFIDHQHGGWFPEVDDANRPDSHQFTGKPDIYHSIQGSLYPLVPGLSGAAAGLSALAPEFAGV